MGIAKSVLGWTICLLCGYAALIACVLTVAPDLAGVSHHARDLYIPVTLMVAAALFNPVAFRHLPSIKAFFVRMLKAIAVLVLVATATYAAGMTRAVYPDFVAERIQHREIHIQARANAGEFSSLDAQDAAARAMRGRLSTDDVAIASAAVSSQMTDAAHRRDWFLNAAASAPSSWHFAIGLAPYAAGEAFEYGIGVKPDGLAARQWYERAARLGVVQAQYRLGRLAETAPRPDYEKAMTHYRQAADRGLPDAQFALARLYDGADATGMKRNPRMAARYYFLAAGQGQVWAQNNLATCYETGDGVAKNDAQSAYWYRQAAEQGDGLAAFELASAYASGRGVMKSAADYRKWMRKYYLTHNEATPPGL